MTHRIVHTLVELLLYLPQLGPHAFADRLTPHRAGGYGDFDFPDAITLYFKLSHLIDVCVLKLLGYDGYYQHKDTDWIPTELINQSAVAA